MSVFVLTLRRRQYVFVLEDTVRDWKYEVLSALITVDIFSQKRHVSLGKSTDLSPLIACCLRAGSFLRASCQVGGVFSSDCTHTVDMFLLLHSTGVPGL